MTSTHHMADLDIENATPQQISQIGVNTIAINNNANSITTNANNITTNTNNITTANSAINANAANITTNANTIASNNTTNTNAINANAGNITTNTNSITTLNTTTTTNTNNISTNTTNITSNTTDITGIKNNTLVSNLKTAVDANSAKTGITTQQANDITANNAKVSMVIGTGANEAMAGNTTTITAQQATDIANNKTELNNIIIGADVMNYSTGRIGKVSGTSGFSIQNSALNGGVLDDAFAGLKQSNTGKTIINGTTNDPISFRKDNVEHYTSNQLKDLVDNINVVAGTNTNLKVNGTSQMKLEEGLITMFNGGDMIHRITAPNSNTAKLFVGGSNTEGTGRVSVGQAQSNGLPTYGGSITYNGDDNPNITPVQDHVNFSRFNNGSETNVMSYSYASSDLYHYGGLRNANFNESRWGNLYAEPRLIGMTAVSSAALSSHRFCYNGATATNNVWYMPHPDFKCVCRTPPGVSTAEYVISFTTDGYFSGRQVHVCLSTSTSQNDIIGSTITFVHSRNSEWTSRIHRISVFDTTLTADAINVRYIFVKEVFVDSAGAVVSAGGNQGFIIFGGRNTHSNGATQTTHYYDNDLTPTTPSDNAQALLCKCWSVPSNVQTTASTTAPFQLIGF